MRRSHSTPHRSRAWLAPLAAGAGLFAGCTSGPAVDTDSAFQGPELRLESAGRSHIVVMEAPNPGWGIELDRTRDRGNHTEVYVSVTRPNPEFLYTQQIVEKRLATDISSGDMIELYARITDHDGRDTSPYAVAGGNSGVGDAPDGGSDAESPSAPEPTPQSDQTETGNSGDG